MKYTIYDSCVRCVSYTRDFAVEILEYFLIGMEFAVELGVADSH